MPSDIAGFKARIVPGENALDTKTSPVIEHASVIDIRHSKLHGLQVYDSELAFRIRGANKKSPRGAKVLILNALVYNVKNVTAVPLTG